MGRMVDPSTVDNDVVQRRHGSVRNGVWQRTYFTAIIHAVTSGGRRKRHVIRQNDIALEVIRTMLAPICFHPSYKNSQIIEPR